MAKSRYPAFISPVGTAVYPYLITPDVRHNADGIFKVDLALPEELAQEFITRLEGELNEFFSTELNTTQQTTLAKRAVWQPEFTRPEYPDGASDEERAAIKDAHVPEATGNVVFRMKMNAKFNTRKGDVVEQQPIVVSADTGERVTEHVWTGSTIRAKGQIVPYINNSSQTAGLSLRLKSVQVIDLVTGTGSGAYWNDFENE